MIGSLKFDLYVDIITEKAKRMRGVIELQWGELSASPPVEIEKYFVEAFKGGYVRYTSPYGDLRLREVICEKLKRKNGIEADVDNVLVTVGGTAAINFAFKLLAGDSSYVLIQSPSWFGYAGIAEYVGARIVRLKESEYSYESFREIYEKIRSKGGQLKAIVLNYPSNPTGHIFSMDVLKQAIEFSEDHNVILISDEAYEDYVFEGRHISIGSLGSLENILSVFTLSKTYAFTGLRVGYVVGGKEMIASLAVAQVHTYISPPSVNQYVARRVLEDRLEEIYLKRYLDHLKLNLEYVRKFVREHSLQMVEPKGGIYAFIRLPGVDSAKFCLRLIEEEKVAVAPGVDFGGEWTEWIRVTIAKSREELEEGLHRIAKLYETGH